MTKRNGKSKKTAATKRLERIKKLEQIPSFRQRPVGACYRRARQILAEGKTASPRLDLPDVPNVVKFLRRRKRCETYSDEFRLQREFPGLTGAFGFLKQSSPGEISTLNARLLSGEPDESISQWTLMSPAGVEAYRWTFFDIETRRDCRDFMMHQVIGLPSADHSDEEIRDILLKTVAYFGGRGSLDNLLYPGFSAAGEGGDARDVLADLTHTTLQLQAAAAIQRVSPSDERCLRELLQASRQIRREQAKDSDNLNALERHINAMLQEIPWTTGREAESALPASIAEYDDAAMELRSDELMFLAAEGKLPKDIEEEIKTIDFPTLRAQRHHQKDSKPQAPPDGEGESSGADGSDKPDKNGGDKSS